MWQRCSNPKHQAYTDYGGRGITVDPAWRLYSQFLADMGERPKGLTLERKDNNKGYSKTNCKWATWKEQQNNRRSTVMLTHNGKTQSVTQWAEELGWDRQMLFQRIRAHGKNSPKVFAPKGKYLGARGHAKNNY